MANQTIFDLTAETAMTASHRVPVQDTGASTAAQSATFALMGGLEWDTYGTPNQNNAAVVGKIIGWDISTLSADRNWTLPNDAKLGERCGIFITTGDDAYEVDILTDSTNSQINGVAHGSTSWSRLFIANECLILRCIKAGGADDTDWIVEYDGRIPCLCIIYGDTATTVDTTPTTPSFSASTDNGSLFSPDSVTLRRDGNIDLKATFMTGATVDSSSYAVCWIRAGAGTPSTILAQQYAHSSSNNRRVYHNCDVTRVSSDGDAFDIQVSTLDAGSEYTPSTSALATDNIQFIVREILP